MSHSLLLKWANRLKFYLRLFKEQIILRVISRGVETIIYKKNLSILYLQFKDKLALAETGELAGSDDSTMTGSLVDEPRQPTKKYTGYSTPRVTSKTRKAANDHPDSPVMGSRGTGASRDLQDRLV